jgi:hypothetical protein
MEPYPHHYTCRPKPTESTDPTIRSMVDELQQMVQHLGKKIEGRCDNTVEQHAEEHFISLEMARVEADAECADLDKHFSGLKLKVGRLNRFMERETMAFPQGTLGILNINDSTSARLSPSMPPTALMGTASNHLTGIVSLGLPSLASRSTIRTSPKPILMLLILELMSTLVVRFPPMLSQFEPVTGNCLKSIFRCSVVKISNSGGLIVRTILTCMGWKSRFGSVSLLCM